MLFHRRFWAGLADGTITLAFRRWERPRAVAGATHKVPGGVIAIEHVTVVDPEGITERDARRAGFASRPELLEDLERYGQGPIHRVEFHFAGPDPRVELRERVELSSEDADELRRRLERLDRARVDGPWTTTVLRLIADRPAKRAADLAQNLGRETLPFKRDVRKLKDLGLTESLEIGYRLSPRGRAFLDLLAHGADANP